MEAGLSGLLGLTAQELVVWMEFKTECGIAPSPCHSMRASSAKDTTMIVGFARRQKNVKVLCFSYSTHMCIDLPPFQSRDL